MSKNRRLASPTVGSVLERIGRRAARRHRSFILGWILLAITVAVIGQAAGGRTTDNFTIPGAESQTALDLLEAKFPAVAGDSASVVFESRAGINAPQVRPAVQASVHNLGKLPKVSQTNGKPAVNFAVSPNHPTIALATVQYRVQAVQLGTDAFTQLRHATAPARAAGVRVEYGGAVVDYADRPPEGSADELGLLVSVFILLFAFGSVVAMGLPIGTALLGLAVGLSAITLVASVTDVGTVAPTLGEMIGLGVGIDYSLFIVTRYRENRARGLDVEAAVTGAVSTAGQAVFFAGLTVVIALCGLALSGIPYVATLGFMAGLVVLVMVAAALTLLPALIALVGDHIDKLNVRLPRRRAAGERDPASTVWVRWAHVVTRHPRPFALGAAALLLTIAIPVLSLRLGESDDGNLPPSTTQRQAFDLIAQGFGPGANGPLVIVVALPTPSDTALMQNLAKAAGPPTRGVADVLPAIFSPDGSTAELAVIPTSSPDAQATNALVDRLRDDILPKAISGTGARAYLGGITAAFIDIAQRMSERLPYLIAAVVVLAFLLLMCVFRSVLIPLTAAVMNLLSVGAAYGVVVAVFQWGWAKSVVGLDSTVPIVPFVPMMMFAILFGLSMDYQVFLLTRMREEFDRTHDGRAAVVTGLASTARVITSAALIMITVFGAFVASSLPTIKMFGLGMAFAVLLDATVVRLVLVPALMELFGSANWWLPRWLDHLLPRVSIE